MNMKRFLPFILSGVGIVAVLVAAYLIYINYGPVKIRVAVSKEDLPFSFQDPTTFQMNGMDVDLLNAMVAKENVTFEFVGVNEADLLTDVSTCKYDAGIGVLPISIDGHRSVAYTDPYMKIGQTIIVRATDTEITGKDSLVGRQVAVLVGSKNAEELGADPSVFIVLYESVDQMFQSLAKGNVQAVIADNTIAVLYVTESKGALKNVGAPFDEENIGIAVCPNATNVLNRLNRGIFDLKAAGQLDSLFALWLSGEKQIPSV
jgi:ABC-type amino acid transport substrate-binding protein